MMRQEKREKSKMTHPGRSSDAVRMSNHEAIRKNRFDCSVQLARERENDQILKVLGPKKILEYQRKTPAEVIETDANEIRFAEHKERF